jgi:hypothetical protein
MSSINAEERIDFHVYADESSHNSDKEASDSDSEEDNLICYGVSLVDPENDIKILSRDDKNVINKSVIEILYDYPFSLTWSGPSDKEKKLRGWIFQEVAPNGEYFTRADLARVISDRYQSIYKEEEGGTTEEVGLFAGSFNRVSTNGKYGIWGHQLGDLILVNVIYYPVDDCYRLVVDS